MDSFEINLADVTVIIVVVLSGVFALARGMVHEVLSIAAWVGAAFATFYGFPLVQPYTRSVIPLPLLADIAAGVAIFVIVLIVLSVITHRIARRVRDSDLGPIDRSLGFVFGLLRGAALICLAWLLLMRIAPQAQHPPWLAATLAEARTRPLIERGAAVIGSLISAQPQDRAQANGGAEILGAQDAGEQTYWDLLMPKPESAALGNSSPGYKDREREALDRLIENSQ